MAQRGPSTPTCADIEALPSHLRGEIIDGQLVVMPRPRPRHARAATSLATSLQGPFDLGDGGPGGWWILLEPELHLDGPRIPIVPDLAGWRRERLPELPDEAAISLPPDWICEVLSPSTEKLDRGAKMETYGRHGVPWAWLVDPETEALEVFRNEGGRWGLQGTWRCDAVAPVPPFEAVALRLARLWGGVAPR